jgi:hypothetical protein
VAQNQRPNGQPQGSHSGAWAGSLCSRAGASEEPRGLNLVLAPVIASFPAVDAIKLPVLAETDTGIRVAKGTVTIAGAGLLGVITDNASELSVEHRLNASPCHPAYLAFVILGHPTWKINHSRLLEPVALICTSRTNGSRARQGGVTCRGKGDGLFPPPTTSPTEKARV